MPYCEKCGKQISESSKFCSGCGEPQDNNLPVVSASADQSFPYVSSGWQYLNNADNIIFRTGYSNRLFTRWIFFCFIEVIGTFISVCVINLGISHIEDVLRKYRNHYSSSYNESYETLKELVSIMEIFRAGIIIAAIFVLGTYIIKCFQIRQNCLTITKDGINGVACPSLGFGTLDFNIRFDQITSVSVKSGHIIFTTTLSNKKYHCCIEDYVIARQIIKKILVEE